MALANLRDLLNRHFTKDELRQLCLDLQIEYENLPGDTRIAKAQSLLEYCLRHNRLPDLVQQCAQVRPNMQWPDAASLLTAWQDVQREIETKDRQRLKAAFPDEDDAYIDALLSAGRAKKEAAFFAEQFGGGAVAQGDKAKALGQGAVDASGAEVGGSLNTGEQSAGRDLAGRDIIKNIYYGPPTDDPAAALRIYRRTLLDGSATLPLRGVDVGASDPDAAQDSLGLAHVYVHLNTTTQVADKEKREPGREEKTRPLAALEAAVTNRWLVLTGEPGGGKSTFAQHLAHCLAAHSLEPEAGWLGHLPAWPPTEAERLPLLVILRDFGRALPLPLPPQADPTHLWQFITDRLAAQNLSFATPHIERALEQGQALLLLDGLDELPTVAQRRFVRDAILAFARRYHRQNRYLITCRILSYQLPAKPEEPDLRLPAVQFPVYELAQFDAKQVDQFIHAWYAELARLGSARAEDTPGLVARLQEAVRQPTLWPLAVNPLLLTVMALVHAHKGRLPEARALLYEETVEMLLWRWEQVKIGQGAHAPRLRQLLLDAGRSDLDLKRLLWRLAYQAHAQGGSQAGLADVAELDLRQGLAALAGGDWNWAEQVLGAMKLRAGLLVERRPGVFSFPHRTFQEYLAGAHLATQSGFAANAARLVGEGAFWREAILLAAGRLVHYSGELDRPLALVQRLLLGGESELGWRQAWLAGDILREAGRQRVAEDALGRVLLAQVQGRLAALVDGGRLTVRERADAGDTLAALGDKRPGVGVIQVEGRELPDILLAYIPPGPFCMGADEGEKGVQEHEKPLHRLNMRDGYWLARYPVTVAQFAAFVEQSGYRPNRGDNWCGVDNRPVVWVTWEDAIAFCRWLDGQWRAMGWLPPGYSVTLPSEAEWEKGARGGLEIPTAPIIQRPDKGLAAALRGDAPLTTNLYPERRYPWGNEWDAARANHKDSDLVAACVAGAFPGGVSPYGLLEMSGNVWEWTRSRWGKDLWKTDFGYPYELASGREVLDSHDLRVLRGGSWLFSASTLRCASRIGDLPLNWLDGHGFRVCVSPFSTSGL